jgi:ABC-2 type transport system permease protein
VVSAPDAAPVGSASARPEPWRGLAWLSARECLRVSKLWTQTMLAPVVSSILFILVFGLSLGSRIKQVSGFEYDVFIVPGLIAMAMAQAAYSNNSSSIFQARSDRYIDDVLAAPMRPWQMNLGLTIGGAFRAVLIGVALGALAIPLTGAPVERPLALAAAALLLVTLFGALGVVVGIYAETFDHHTFINNIVILPLTFVGGVFYSVDILPSPWEQLSHANPLFYVVNALRYGFLGSSDVSVWLSFAVTAAIAAAMVAWSQYLFSTGKRLKP